MSGVTKILIVVVVVMCIAFSMTVVSFVAKSANWKELADDYRQDAQISDAHQRNLMAAHAAELASARDTIRTQLNRSNGLETELEGVKQEVARQRGEIAQLTADNRRADALAQRLTNELGIAQAGRAAIEAQRQELESRNIELEQRNSSLSERVNELTTRVTVLIQQRRQQAQEINILREESRRVALRTGSPRAGGSGESVSNVGARRITPLTARAPARISGQVRSVDGNLVTISVGSADSVQKGTTFVVFRGSDYVGDVEITDVQPNLSAGRLIRTRQGMSVRAGDQVQDEFHFSTPP
ncbi:MAG: hypothetical protein IID36_07340 [Planctomycetes bacterium]|nr:hypothetical protein [Planctomycetota bacterium]